MKTGVYELSKARVSDLKESAWPRYNRVETKKSMEKEVLAKAGSAVFSRNRILWFVCFRWHAGRPVRPAPAAAARAR